MGTIPSFGDHSWFSSDRNALSYCRRCAQNKYKTSVKKKAERQILAVKPGATEEELTAVFEQEVWWVSPRSLWLYSAYSAALFSPARYNGSLALPSRSRCGMIATFVSAGGLRPQRHLSLWGTAQACNIGCTIGNGVCGTGLNLNIYQVWKACLVRGYIYTGT